MENEVLKLKTRIVLLESALKKTEIENGLITEAVNDLKCCGNCAATSNEIKCPYNNSDIPDGWKGYCESWEFDELTQKERMIE